MTEVSLYDVYQRLPEEMSVGQLNTVVRALREALYQKDLRYQALEELVKQLQDARS